METVLWRLRKVILHFGNAGPKWQDPDWIGAHHYNDEDGRWYKRGVRSLLSLIRDHSAFLPT